MLLYVISSLALALIGVILFFRANALRIQRRNWHWKLRMLGFVLAGSSCWAVIALDRNPSIYETIMRVGFAFVFATTPHLPPLWKFLWEGTEGDVA